VRNSEPLFDVIWRVFQRQRREMFIVQDGSYHPTSVGATSHISLLRS